MVTSCGYDYQVSEDGNSNSSVSGGPGLNTIGYSSSGVLDRVCFPSTATLNYFDGGALNQVSTTFSNLMSNGYLSNFINDIKNVRIILFRIGKFFWVDLQLPSLSLILSFSS